MDSHSTMVKKAAEFLDKYCNNKEWRKKVDTRTLDMLDGDFCILGQIYGDYEDGRRTLTNASDHGKFNQLYEAFNYAAYNAAWVEYLSTDSLVGTKWVWHSFENSATTTIYTYMQKVTIGGRNYVIYSPEHDDSHMDIRTEVEFNQKFKRAPEKPAYVDGRLYTDASGKHVFIYNAAYNYFIIVNGDSGCPTPHTVERAFGPLKEFTLKDKTFTVTTL